MNRIPDIMFMAEYIKGVLYFATIREGKNLKSSSDTHFFSIDDELVYENYYSDFGPLNLGCVYKYCKLMNDKLKQYLHKQTIVHYTSIDPKKKANSAYLLGCYGVLYLNLHPRDALKPLMVHGQSYRPFKDATQGESDFTISLIDCLQAISKAKNLGFFNFQDFNYDEYERLDKIQGGDLNWIVPGKFLAFIGPVDYSVSVYHPPKMYISYFLENNVKIVIRLNKRLYDGNVFNNAGINHYDLFFPDGSCPPRHILMKFLQIAEESKDAIAVHCKAGLGRTGSLIGCYLIKHYRMTSHEAIGWMRICRPGSVIGHQQAWLEQLQAWLMKQGDLYRKRVFNDTDKLPCHEFGVYSIAEKTLQQRPVMFHKSPSPLQPISRQAQSDIVSPIRPQASKVRDKRDDEDEEEFITSCDLTVNPGIPMTQMKGCIIRNNLVPEAYEESGSYYQERENIPLWKRMLRCNKCVEVLKDEIWAMSVRCARVVPKSKKTIKLCSWMDKVTPYKAKKEPLEQWRLRPDKINPLKTHIQTRRDVSEPRTLGSRGRGAGEPRAPSTSSRRSYIEPQTQRKSATSNDSRKIKSISGPSPNPAITTFRTTTGPVIKNVNDARNFLLRSSLYNKEREKQLISSVIVTPHSCSPKHTTNFMGVPGHTKPPPQMTSSSFSTATSRGSSQPPQQRHRLGRSPSPIQARMSQEKTRATNTPPPPPLPKEKFTLKKAYSKTTLSDALSRLKLTGPRNGSIGAASVGAASLGARRDAPSPNRAPSVRSDERPLATQGDLLNSIKFQRRLRETLHTTRSNSKEKSSIKSPNTRTSTGPREAVNQDINRSREKPNPTPKNSFGSNRPSSPKARRTPHL